MRGAEARVSVAWPYSLNLKGYMYNTRGFEAVFGGLAGYPSCDLSGRVDL